LGASTVYRRKPTKKAAASLGEAVANRFAGKTG
jgi:hypothetical protein